MKGYNGIVGKFFHSIKDGNIAWQGFVLSKQLHGYYLVQLFEWLMGEPSEQRLIQFKDMVDWKFYSTKEEMDYAWNREQDILEKHVADSGINKDTSNEMIKILKI